MRYFQSAKAIYVQSFSVLRPSPAHRTPQPIVLNKTQGDALAQIYESFTDEIVSPPSFLPSIETDCIILEQKQDSNITTKDDESALIIKDNDTFTELWQVDFSCEWTSRFTTVDYLPRRFLDHVTLNLELLADAMGDAADLALPAVAEAFPPKVLAIVHNDNDNKGTTLAPSKTQTIVDDGDTINNSNPPIASDPTVTLSVTSSSDNLTAGAVSAIVLVGSIVGIGILVVLVVCWKKKRQKMSATTPNKDDINNGENHDSKGIHPPSGVVVDDV